MSADLNKLQDDIEQDAKETPPAHELFGELSQRAREATSATAFLRGAFRRIVERYRAPYGTVQQRFGAEVFEDNWHAGAVDPAFWKDAVNSLQTETLATGQSLARVYRAKDRHATVALVSVPISGTSGSGAMAAVVHCRDEHVASLMLGEFRALAGVLGFLGAEVETRARQRGPGSDRQELDGIVKAATMSGVRQLAYALTNGIRNRLGCDLVAFGLVRRGRVVVESIAGFDEVKSQAPGVRQMTAAMNECADFRRQIVVPNPAWGEEDPRDFRLHRQWHEQAGRVPVATIPIVVEGRCIAVVALKARAGEHFAREQMEAVDKQVNGLGTAIIMITRAGRSMWAHAAESIGRTMRSVLARRAHVRRAVIAGSLALTGWIAFGSMSYRVTVPATVAPLRPRKVTAPFGGVIERVLVRAGERVDAGTVLFQMDVEPLRRQLLEIDAQQRAAEITIDQAMAERRLSDAEIARAEQRVLDVKAAGVRAEIERGTVRVGVPALVVKGDPQLLVGQTVAAGAEVLDLALDDRWNLEVDIDESRIGAVMAGAPVAFSSDALPDLIEFGHLTRVRPAAEPRNGKNVFVGEVELDRDAAWIRNGMAGVARLDLGDRPVWWILSHRMINVMARWWWL